MDVEPGAALGFGIQGEHFDGLPVDAATIGGPKRGPAAKLDSEESIDAKDDNQIRPWAPLAPRRSACPSHLAAQANNARFS